MVAQRVFIHLSVLSIVLVGLASLTSCTAQRTGPSPTGGEQGAAQASYITARTLDDLIAQSPVIVVGRVIGPREIVNMARKPGNPREPDPETFILGQVYDVAVERYLKGTGGDILYVVQSEGFINVNRTPVSEQTMQQARETFPHIPMVAGKTYLLFLAPLSWDPQYLAGRLHPWRFVLTPDGMAEPESPWHDAPTVFPPIPAEDLLGQVEEMVNQAG